MSPLRVTGPKRLVGRIALLGGLALAAATTPAQVGTGPVQGLTPIRNSVVGSTALGSISGPVSTSDVVEFGFALQLKNAAGLQQMADAVSNPTSLLYRQFMTPEQIGAEFGPDQSDVDALISYIKSQGLTVTMVAKTGMFVFGQGSAAQVEKAFGTSLVNVQRAADGTTFQTNTTPVMLPASLAGKIVGVSGLDTSIQMKRRATTTQLDPALFRSAYNGANAFGGGYQGQGVNIAIANWDGFKLNNIPIYCSAFGQPFPVAGAGSNVTIRLVGSGSKPDNKKTPGGEGDLDIQMVLMAAPLANVIDYDDTTNSNGSFTDANAPLTTYTAISNDNTADVVTESYGWSTYSYNGGTGKGTYNPTPYVMAHTLHLTMTTQGMTYLAATGDTGTNEFNHVTSGGTSATSFCYPDIDPEVLMVGGSVVTADTGTGAMVSEVTWGLAGGDGGTGGFDTFDTVARGFAMNVPGTYQTRDIPTFTAANNFRLVPDIAGHASGQDGIPAGSTGWAYVIAYNQGNAQWPLGSGLLISGTSCASPADAGGIGVVLQRLFNGVTPVAGRTNVRLGRIQDWLYAKGNTSIFHDITAGNTVGTVPGSAVNCVPLVGWDFATGWGSLNWENFYRSFLSGKKNP